MTFLKGLQSHRGGLLRLKTELFWYSDRGFDDSPGRVCLVLDAAREDATTAGAAARTGTATAARTRAAALLLIDGCPHWVWVAPKDVEIL